LVDRSDIVIAIFYHKLGSPTQRAISGTAEEISRSVRAGKPVHIFVNTAELETLRSFRAETAIDWVTPRLTVEMIFSPD
jgi:hypothetical protein